MSSFPVYKVALSWTTEQNTLASGCLTAGEQLRVGETACLEDVVVYKCEESVINLCRVDAQTLCATNSSPWTWTPMDACATPEASLLAVPEFRYDVATYLRTSDAYLTLADGALAPGGGLVPTVEFQRTEPVPDVRFDPSYVLADGVGRVVEVLGEYVTRGDVLVLVPRASCEGAHEFHLRHPESIVRHVGSAVSDRKVVTLGPVSTPGSKWVCHSGRSSVGDEDYRALPGVRVEAFVDASPRPPPLAPTFPPGAPSLPPGEAALSDTALIAIVVGGSVVGVLALVLVFGLTLTPKSARALTSVLASLGNLAGRIDKGGGAEEDLAAVADAPNVLAPRVRPKPPIGVR